MISAALAGMATECMIGTARTGSSVRSTWRRQAMFGVAAEMRLIAPTAKATAPASVGRPSA